MFAFLLWSGLFQQRAYYVTTNGPINMLKPVVFFLQMHNVTKTNRVPWMCNGKTQSGKSNLRVKT